MDLGAWLICPMIIHGNLIKAEMNSTKTGTARSTSRGR